ncbi:ADP-ribosylglycohydrolase family protein [Stenotrophomonas sp. 364]|uniref:ADP-ribosylglycohydrolase family protein n=1 Tax=Stenotrophomonas sp. 364 TaxID=2691571 RepID=UPI0013177BA9|nr:ADP-ribosylglycohydrolase family protein [Stenotrophomonas sp. 364]QHB71064.1 ADP-ribosylglycohydrolase family protein [Stenotrophomonas sp. 364]
MDLQNRYRGALLGLAAGDAVGTTLEFKPRGSFEPLTDMVGGGPFDLEPGQWTDDTSMALCLAESLIRCDAFDPRDQMNRYANWYQHGYWSSTGTCFDIGVATRGAIHTYLVTGEPLAGNIDPDSAGNGSIMRLAPVALRFARKPELQAMAVLSSRTTHAAEECLDACRLLVVALERALAGCDKTEVLDLAAIEVSSQRLRDIAAGGYRSAKRDQVRGTGYVVDSLEAALWCFHQHDTFAGAVLEAANLGDDADTTAAVVGQLAGAFYGVAGIPAAWLARVHRGDEIAALADGLLQRNLAEA